MQKETIIQGILMHLSYLGPFCTLYRVERERPSDRAAALSSYPCSQQEKILPSPPLTCPPLESTNSSLTEIVKNNISKNTSNQNVKRKLSFKCGNICNTFYLFYYPKHFDYVAKRHRGLFSCFIYCIVPSFIYTCISYFCGSSFGTFLTGNLV